MNDYIDNTIQKLNPSQCTGCLMCSDACPVDAISSSIKQDGFWYPSLNLNVCTGCGKCAALCPQLHLGTRFKDHSSTSTTCYGAKSRDFNVRYTSSSGGIFSELAYEWLSNGGIICAAEYDENQNIFHKIEGSRDGAIKQRQSKYAQSSTAGIFLETKQKLDNDNSVMFCGTPCQIAALLSYLNKPYENLLTIDFICLGVASPGVYQGYLKYLEKRYKSHVTNVWFKNKEKGWRSVGVRIEFANGKTYSNVGIRDLFMRLFTFDVMINRDCCYQCNYRSFPHASDLTLADFWGLENINPDFDDDKGVSAVVISSSKGNALFDQIKKSIDYFETDLETIVKGNTASTSSPKISDRREKFFSCFARKGFRAAAKQCGTYNIPTRVFLFSQRIQGKIQRLIEKNFN